MFCSTCKRIEIEFNEVRRKICDSGHILCSICDKDSNDCQICGSKIKNIIYVSFFYKKIKKSKSFKLKF